MTTAWNVSDLQVFDNLAIALDKTVAQLPEIKAEEDIEIRKTYALINDSIAEIKQRIAAAKANLESATAAQHTKAYMNEVQYAMNHAPGALSSVAKSHAAQVQSAQRPYLLELEYLETVLADLERVQHEFEDDARLFNQDMATKESEYADQVSKCRTILNHYGVLLAQSRAAIQ